MNRLPVYILVLLAIIMTGCASEVQLTSSIADYGQQCMSRSRSDMASPEESADTVKVESTLSRSSQDRPSTILTLKGGKCYVNISGIHATCGTEFTPGIRKDEDKIIISLDGEEKVELDCICDFEVSFNYGGISPGKYHIVAEYCGQIFLDRRDIILMEGEPVTL